MIRENDMSTMNGSSGYQSNVAPNEDDEIPKAVLPLARDSSMKDLMRGFVAFSWFNAVSLIRPHEYFVSVDHFSVWKQSVLISVIDGGELREYFTQRYIV